MSKSFQTAFVIADSRESIAELTSGASELAASVILAYTGNRDDAVNADVAYWLDTENNSFVNYLGNIAELVTASNANLIICSPSRNGRLAAAFVAAKGRVSVLSDCTSIKETDGRIEVCRMTYGGAAVKTERSKGSFVVLCPAEGLFEANDNIPAGKIIAVEASGSAGFVEKRSKEVRKKSITAAKNIVGVGRGLGSEDNLPLAMRLAKAIDGEVGCTRPVAEENNWLPRECNIGISGAIVKPNLYIACGISGQIQHLVGINDSRVIAAINRDKNAPIFSACDIGIVGDVSTVIPELLKKLEQS